MADKVLVLFDMKMFTSEVKPVMLSYFKGEVTALEASKLLGWSKEVWERHMSGIFSVVDKEKTQYSPKLGEIKVYEGIHENATPMVATPRKKP